ncbi:MAG: 3-dehydroquinate synthase [Rhizobiales bacterium]|nr:3-dehydroquinate synthase [Hyphomicrobiales bacterium]
MKHAEMVTEPSKVHVSLGERSYDIAIGHGLLPGLGARIAPLLSRPLTAIVTDENVATRHLQALEDSLRAAGIKTTAIILPPGEATKSFDKLAEVCDSLLAASIERRDRVIAFGGGVIGDLAGFAAAILRRGVGFIQIPTTLLAQVDSSVGGKTGINSRHGKNLIGSFHQPVAVFADTALLETLPRRELAAGYAEVVKYGALGDAGFFRWLEESVDGIFGGNAALRGRAVEVSCLAKARIVAEDETETGVRALLNLGHTFGHALEAATGYSSRLLHGEAVAIGMVQAARFSEAEGHCPQGTADRLARHLARAGLPVSTANIADALPSPPALLEIMRQDKKSVGGKLTLILLRGIGEAFIARNVDERRIVAFLEEDRTRR